MATARRGLRDLTGNARLIEAVRVAINQAVQAATREMRGTGIAPTAVGGRVYIGCLRELELALQSLGFSTEVFEHSVTRFRAPDGLVAGGESPRLIFTTAQAMRVDHRAGVEVRLFRVWPKGPKFQEQLKDHRLDQPVLPGTETPAASFTAALIAVVDIKSPEAGPGLYLGLPVGIEGKGRRVLVCLDAEPISEPVAAPDQNIVAPAHYEQPTLRPRADAYEED